MALEKFTFLDEVGIQKLAEALLTKVNSRVAERIVQEISDASDANHVASAALLNSLLKTRDALISGNTTAAATNKTSIDGVVSDIADLETKVDTNTTDITSASNDIQALDEKVDAFTHLTIDIVTGSIDTVADPKTDILYFQRDDESDNTWMLYIYREDGTWVQIGDTGVDLSNYWSKDDTTDIKESLSVPEMTPLAEDKILAAIDAAFKNTDALAPKLYWVNTSLPSGDPDNPTFESAGKCTVEGYGKYKPGDTVTLTATAAGYVPEDSVTYNFDKWLISDNSISVPDEYVNPITFIMPSNNVIIVPQLDIRFQV